MKYVFLNMCYGSTAHLLIICDLSFLSFFHNMSNFLQILQLEIHKGNNIL